MTSNSNKNFDDEPEMIIRLLKMEGLSEVAKKINDAYIGASTGNELTAGVNFYVKQIPLDKLSATTRKRVELYLKHLHETNPILTK